VGVDIGDFKGDSIYLFFNLEGCSGVSGESGMEEVEAEGLEGSNEREFWLCVRCSFSAVLRCCIAWITEAGVPAVLEGWGFIRDEMSRLDGGGGREMGLFPLKNCE